jgi:hypothetical protein
MLTALATLAGQPVVEVAEAAAPRLESRRGVSFKETSALAQTLVGVAQGLQTSRYTNSDR